MSRHFCTAPHRLYRESSRAVFDFECSWTRSYLKPDANAPELPAPSRGAQEKSTVRLLYLDFLAFCCVHPTQAI